MKKIINDENIRQKLIDKKITKNDYKIIIDIIRILLHLTIRSNQNVTMEILQDYLMIIMHTFTCLDKIGIFLFKKLDLNFEIIILFWFFQKIIQEIH